MTISKTHSQDPFPAEQIAGVRAQLEATGRQLRALLEDEFIMAETPLEVQNAVELAADSLDAAVDRLKTTTPSRI